MAEAGASAPLDRYPKEDGSGCQLTRVLKTTGARPAGTLRIPGCMIVTAFYYLVWTPVGWLVRQMGSDFLCREWDREARTYWVLRKQTGHSRLSRANNA